MVALAQSTRDPAAAMLGVLGHEYGHLKHRHPMRQFVRGSVLSILIAWWIGDVSSVLATAAPVLLATRYSRDFEREADREAASLLKSVGRPVEPLVELFGKLEGERAGKGSDRPRGLADYFSSHPGTAERIRILREAGR
jgi:Zn-dependent protease with chaperone function